MHPKHGGFSETRAANVHIGGTRIPVNGFGPDMSRKPSEKEMSSSVACIPLQIVVGSVKGYRRHLRTRGGSAKMPLRIPLAKMHWKDGRVSGIRSTSDPLGGKIPAENGFGQNNVDGALPRDGLK